MDKNERRRRRPHEKQNDGSLWRKFFKHDPVSGKHSLRRDDALDNNEMEHEERLSRSQVREQSELNDQDEKRKRLGRKLDKVILVLVILIVLVYLFMRFVNF